ncbi:MAG: polyprenyl synthetase family protein [Anaerolineales bacterium]
MPVADDWLKVIIEKQWANSRAWPDLIRIMRLAVSLDDDLTSGTGYSPSRLARLPNLCCQAAGGEPQWADDLSTAWILFYAGADVMDSVQDQDTPDEWWGDAGSSTALSAASGLYFSASQILNNLFNNKEIAGDVSEVISEFYDQFLLMCSGQFRDIILVQPSLEEYWRIIEAKSGAFFKLACWCGARLATEDISTLEYIGVFGSHLGVIVQITDELEDVQSPRGVGGIGQRPELANSLPVIYALEVLPQTEQLELKEKLNSAPDDTTAAEAALEIIDNSGAALYLLSEMERHRSLGAEALEKAVENSPARDTLLAILNSI